MTSLSKNLLPWRVSLWSRVLEFIATLTLCLATGLVGSLILGAIVLFITQPAQANETELPLARVNESQQGRLLFKREGEKGVYATAPILKTDVSMDISGLLAHVKVEQRFTNPTKEWQEGVYVFPLPDNAAVDRLRMRIGERLIEGKIKEKAEARRTYEQAKRSGKKAALIEQQRPNMFTNSVANIGPGESITITIHYQQRLEYLAGEFSLRFPMIVNPRYTPNSDKAMANAISLAGENSGFNIGGWSGALEKNEIDDTGGLTAHPVTLNIALDAGFPLRNIDSPYHRIVTREQGGKHHIRLAAGDIPADRDFVLNWQPNLSDQPQAALFSEIRDEADYALLMFMPPHPGGVGTAKLGRELVFVIDTSGSMGGASIRQARSALHLAVKRLVPTDSFNIIQFNSTTSQLFSSAVPANQINLNLAQQYITSLVAGGGTEMLPALKAALPGSEYTRSNPSVSDKLRQIVFLTDGSVSNEAALFELIHSRLGESRLFTVGIGSAPNSYFMHKAAKFGRGTYTHIGNIAEVEEKMLSMFSRIEKAVLTNIKLQWMIGKTPVNKGKGFDLQTYPNRIADLYFGEPLVISARLPEQVDAVRVSGFIGKHRWQRTLQLNGGAEKSGVAKRWAREKIASLMDSLHDGANRGEVKKAVIRTALNHHLVSKYTSLVAVDVTPTRPGSRGLVTKKLRTPLPAGSVSKHIDLPRTATAATLHGLLGSIALLLGLISLLVSQGYSRIPRGMFKHA